MMTMTMAMAAIAYSTWRRTASYRAKPPSLLVVQGPGPNEREGAHEFRHFPLALTPAFATHRGKGQPNMEMRRTGPGAERNNSYTALLQTLHLETKTAAVTIDYTYGDQ